MRKQDAHRRLSSAAGEYSHLGRKISLASRTVKDLVAGSDYAFTSRGVHSLKGVPEEWELLAVA